MMLPRYFAVFGSCVKPAEGTMAVFHGPGSGMPIPPNRRPPKRVLWPPMPKIVALVIFKPKLIRNGTGGLAQVLVAPHTRHRWYTLCLRRGRVHDADGLTQNDHLCG